MKKILLSLLGILTLGLINFSIAGFESLLSGTTTSINGYTNISNVNTIKLSISNSDFGNIYCLSGTLNSIVNSNCNGNSSVNACNILFGVANNSRGYSAWGYNFQLNGDLLDLGGHIFGCFTLQNVPSGISYIALTTNASSSSNHDFTYDIMKYTLDNSGGGSSSCDYSEYESTIQTLSGNLATCQNDLLTCQNSSSCDYSEYESTIQTLSGNLATCQGLYSTCDNNLSSCSNELNACISNGGSSSCSGDIQWSSLYINNIQHLGASSIFVNIPEEISWSYTNENDEFDLDIEGYNVDTAYIEEVINKSNYIPTSEDLSNVFSNLGLFGSLLVVCLFIILVFYMIKKIFN